MTQKSQQHASSLSARTNYLPLVLVLLAMELVTLAVLAAALKPYTPKVLARDRPLLDIPVLLDELKITGPNQTWMVTRKNWFEFRNRELLGSWLLQQEAALNQEPQDAELVIEDNRAARFTPHRDGQTLDLAQAQALIHEALFHGRSEVMLPVQIKPPQVKLGDLNNLGIKELISRGQSDFSGSTVSRINNIRVGSSQFDGVIIKPGEEFSFNKTLGTITEAKGYLPELVIKREGVSKELGGGLCQVATTAFRAAFFAGLPITQRRNHSYAVHYYEWISDDQPEAVGLDATIYPGAQDMKFINDTRGHILVWTHVEGKRLYFDFFGTADGREVAMDGPHPFDRKLSGAVKSTVTRQVIKNGQTQEMTFKSNYVSPDLYPKLYELPKPEEPKPVEPATNNNN